MEERRKIAACGKGGLRDIQSLDPRERGDPINPTLNAG
ncbi:hypothetical protein PSEWESI4_03544 [Pseudomonas carbonaria]|uniref:Uncharacterized protein n=1 Tax=Zestomonas carbonaria TaxID=2762745 RepID=A0A7U7EQC2_9GAMM|nr:hypothetical protein PSEWESI4_03544 [Pseudomonas carbonaria]